MRIDLPSLPPPATWREEPWPPQMVASQAESPPNVVMGGRRQRDGVADLQPPRSGPEEAFALLQLMERFKRISLIHWIATDGDDALWP